MLFWSSHIVWLEYHLFLVNLTQIVNLSNPIPLIGFGLILIFHTSSLKLIKSHITYIYNEPVKRVSVFIPNCIRLNGYIGKTEMLYLWRRYDCKWLYTMLVYLVHGWGFWRLCQFQGTRVIFEIFTIKFQVIWICFINVSLRLF